MKFYFTYGTSKSQPFQGGWTVVNAESRDDAIKLFNQHHPVTEQGLVNCSSIYDEETFKNTIMYKRNDNFGKTLQETLSLDSCCFCGEKIKGKGNNPWPFDKIGRCCDICNEVKVLPARIKMVLDRCQ